jgi:hypothetical protein
MEVRILYNLNDPDDRMAHMRAIKSLDMASALFEITQNLRKKVIRRFEDDEKEYDEFDGIQEVFDRIHEILEDNNINIDELIN